MASWSRTWLAPLLALTLAIPGCIVVLEEDDGPEPAPVAIDLDDFDATFTVVNRSPWDIYAVHVTPTDAARWGRDILGIDVLERGDSTAIALEPGVWDIKIVDEDGDEYVEWGVDFPPGDDLVWDFYGP